MTTKYAAVHESPNGPGDARPTALQIIEDENLTGKLVGKVILITGCSSGIGIETARALFVTGATLYLTARNIAKAKAALPDLISSERVNLLTLDLNSLDSVRVCAADFLSRSKTLNIFIANAGIMACPEGRTADGFETQFGTNHISHFLLFQLLAPVLLSSATPEISSRAIILSSIGHRYSEPDFDNLNCEGCYKAFNAYGASKTANLWTANEIDRRYGPKGLHAFAVHPGGIMTELTRHLPQDVVAGMGSDPNLEKILKTPQQGAATTVWAATAKALEGKGGKYLEECQISRPWIEADGQNGVGHSAWAYDEVKEGKMWKRSLELIAMADSARDVKQAS